MSRLLRLVPVASLLAALAVPGNAGASGDALAKAVALNGGLQSFTAALHADVSSTLFFR